ncbi:hypothetical protein F2P81_016397 [Scophthalmus maximus]|uniref:Uncharacterized protein n=1 Tax=Scophthalmus maximus TaxID=52904 RepID=A0A6A4SNF2_SCOMX|nr:hypothetical protein F2P81_016397 [Scophthalmus maximus]
MTDVDASPGTSQSEAGVGSVALCLAEEASGIEAAPDPPRARVSLSNTNPPRRHLLFTAAPSSCRRTVNHHQINTSRNTDDWMFKCVASRKSEAEVFLPGDTIRCRRDRVD